ncbi:MAG: SpoIVB peptidase [Oscillospiraceae bacterium]|nr:SpoIVB peptidase [Oscillospiraceae bacterium]
MAKQILRILAAITVVGMIGLLTAVAVLDGMLPDRYYVTKGQRFDFPPSRLNIKADGWANNLPDNLLSRAGNEYSLKLSLPCGAVIKTVSVQVVEPDTVIPAGTPFGIKMFTDGVMVVGLSDIDLAGKNVNPAKNAGIKTGDIIISIDGKKVYYNEDVGEIVGVANGKAMQIKYIRDGNEKTTVLTPVKDENGSYRAGMWVRDSSAGIGTMTFYDPQSGCFGGLGHAICDVDTGEMMPLSSGEAVDVTITGVNRGSSGFPGELKGSFSSNKVIGELNKNDKTGIYGSCLTAPAQHKPVPIATRTELHPGEAQIYCTVSGNTPQSYDVMIEKVSLADSGSTKNMVVRITDPDLLQVTGGIVQGMSGSPIIQDGKLVGAVTHVFVNDPTRGYGIFIENMLDAAG